MWITEFGWDSCTADAMSKRAGWFKKLNWQGVTDLQQAQYLVRSIFCFSERDIDRAYLYFFNDSNKASVHASSGLTRNFKPKMSYWAVSHLYKTLGDFRFKRVISKKNDSYVYEFIHADKRKKIWVVWRAGENPGFSDLTLNLPSSPLKIERMPTKSHKGIAEKWQGKGSKIKLKVSGSPLYIFLR